MIAVCLSNAVFAASRSKYVTYDSDWIESPVSTRMVLNSAHQQIFTAWPLLDRIDVVSTVDYHLIYSIHVASPSTLDISPDGTTLAVGTTSSHILFFDTATFAKTNDVVFRDAHLGISGFVYTANGNAMIRAEAGISTGGGITAYWDHSSNAFRNISYAEQTSPTYITTGPMARSGDYTKIMLGDAVSSGEVQIIDGDTGQILWNNRGYGFQGYIYSLAANRDASRYAVCAKLSGGPDVLAILNSSFDEIFQDANNDCLGMTFSADGSKLYRDVFSASGTSTTQILDVNSFTSTEISNYFTPLGEEAPPYPTFWQAADTTGMVYGMNSNKPPGGVIWVALDTTGTAPQIPSPDQSVHIVRVIDTVGSPQGGDVIRLLCTGVSGTASVSVAGQPATNVQLTASGFLPGSVYVVAQTPPGTPGWADVTVTSNGNSATASKSFQYAASRSIVPFATSPNYLLYDPQRNRLYASHKDQVEVIDVATGTLLTPLVPVGGKLTNSQFAGLSLSPDGQRLYIADFGAGMIHILNLTSPGSGSSIDVGKAITALSSVSPARVFELSNGELLGSGNLNNYNTPGLYLFFIDPVSQTGQWLKDSSGNQITALVWNTTNRGGSALLSGQYFNADFGTVGLWQVGSSANIAPATLTNSYMEATANEDGTIFAMGGSTAGIDVTNPELFDWNQDSIGYIQQHFDAPTPYGTPSFFLDPTGALLYKAGDYEANGGNSLGESGAANGGVEVDDVHTFEPAEKVAFPETLNTSYSPFTDRMMTADPTGRYLFGVTKSGIVIMQLYAVPLSIGNLQPAFVDAQSGSTMTVRGTGFASGAQVSIGGVQVPATYVDPNTLTVTVPQLSPGWQDVTVSLPSGRSYTAAGLLQVIAPQPAPAISGFSPASVPVQSGIPGFDQLANVTVLGSSFEVYDTVEINGQPVPSAFIDSGHMQATIPATLTGQAGSISVSVVSPYAGTSNTASLPMVNPFPMPASQNNAPIYFASGQSFNLSLHGTGFVNGSVIQWNGQNLSTLLIQGEGAGGLETISASIPASLTQLSGNATVTVFNPAPGGGTSAPITATLGLQPVPNYTIFGETKNGLNMLANYFSLPPTVNFGSQVLNTTSKLTVTIQSEGQELYSVSSVAVSGAGFSTTSTTCPALTAGSMCSIPITFIANAAGSVNGVLTIADNLPGSPHSIPITATVVQAPLPVVTLTNIDTVGQTINANFTGTAVLGGQQVPATAWIEYGTDQSLSTYSQSPTWTFTGDGGVSGKVTNLTPNTVYAGRLAVQTAGGIGRSPIHLFATAAAAPWVELQTSQGSSNSATITAGKSATYSLLAWDGGDGYTGTATFTCTGAPTGATCSVSPSQTSIGLSPVTIAVTVTTTGAQSASTKSGGKLPGPARTGVALCLLLGTAAIYRRKRLLRSYLLVCLLILSSAFVSCGGGSSSGSGPGNSPPPPTPTPAGNYVLNVTAVTGGAQNTYSLQLTVQ